MKTAKILKPNLRILLIGQLNNLIGDYYTSPTVWGASIFRQEQTIIQNKSKRDQSQNNFNLATRELTRAKSLVDAGMIPRNEYNQAAEAFDEAKTNLTNAEKNLETVKYQLIPFIVETSVISQKEKPSINVLIKEIWIYDISTGKIWLKRKI